MSTLDLVLERLEKAKNYGRYVAACCPFHGDKRPSFFVYEDTYRCLACGAHGSTQSLLKKLSVIPDRIQTYDTTQSRNPFTRWIGQWGLHRTIQIGYENLERHNGSHYLCTRGIDSKHQNELHIGKLDGFLTFPLYNRWQELIGAVCRVGEDNTSTSKYYLPKGQNPKLLYVPSWEKVNQSREVFVTFGIIDAITLYVMGYASASTITGQSVSPETFKHIGKKIIFVPDKHEEQAALKIAAKLDWRGDVKILSYPIGTKDCNDIFVKDKALLYDYMAT